MDGPARAAAPPQALAADRVYEAIFAAIVDHRLGPGTRLSGDPLFVRMLEELLPTSSLLMALYKAPGEPMCVAHSHRALLGVLDEGSGVRAATEMKRHLGEIERSLDRPTARQVPALGDVFGMYREGAAEQPG